jgi:hypothetical protein
VTQKQQQNEVKEIKRDQKLSSIGALPFGEVNLQETKI